jgi:transportin-1
MLSQAKSSPDITNYLTYILCSLQPSENLSAENLSLARSAAAISLKNIIKTRYRSIPATHLVFIRSSILRCLEDPDSKIRNLVGNVITEIVKTGGILAWPEVFPTLLALAGNDSGNVPAGAQIGAMSALTKVCEDNKKPLDKDYQGQRPLDVILPRLLDLTASPEVKVRALALECINIFIPQKPRALLLLIDTLLLRLFQLAHDTSDDVRRYVCRSFVQLVDVKPEKIVPHMEGLVNYMVLQQRNPDDPDLALDAAEFWLAVGEHRDLCDILGPYLHTIIPCLLESMVYGEDDIARLEGDAEDAHEEDRPEDIKPQFAKNKSARAAPNGQTPVNGVSYDTPEASVQDDSLSEGEIEQYPDDYGDDPEDEWNLRKCSAAALDVLATFFHQPVFDITLPYLKNNLNHPDWPNREAAVLAIGAVADGCMDVVAPHLPELIPYLISLLQDSEAVVRQITCWALGRYSAWAAHLATAQDKAAYFEPMMEGILQKMLDGNKAVQDAAASAFSNLEDTAKKELTPYCKPIIQQFVRCFQVYKDRNMFILYDCVQTLAEHVGPALAEKELTDLLMPALVQRWEKVSDQSRELFPLLECLSYVATAMGESFSGLADPIFSRCIRIVHQNLQEYLLAINNEALDTPDKEFLVSSLDLLSSIIQALPPAISSELVAKSEPKMFDLLRFCMEDPNNDVRQSSYALLGDCAIRIFPQLQPVLPDLMPVLIQQLDLDSMPDEEADAAFSVINNACWSCGEIAIQQKHGMAPYVEKLYERLFSIISNPGIPASVNENAAVALGRLGLHCSEGLALHLAQFARLFLQILQPVDDTDEKGQAFLGLNRTIVINPQAMEDCLLEYFKASAAFNQFRESDLKDSFRQVCLITSLHSFW